jgi:hypothetical protein
MNVKHIDSGKIYTAVKIGDNTYKIAGKEISKEDFEKKFEVVAEQPKPKEVSSSSKIVNTIALEPEIGGDNIQSLFEALSKCQGQMEVGKKNTEGYGYSYMDMSQVIELSKKPLMNNGLSVLQFPSSYVSNDMLFVRVTTIVTHKDGGYVKCSFDTPVKESKKQALIQTIGSALSYQSRYSRNNILGISADKDTDGV